MHFEEDLAEAGRIMACEGWFKKERCTLKRIWQKQVE